MESYFVCHVTVIKLIVLVGELHKAITLGLQVIVTLFIIIIILKELR